MNSVYIDTASRIYALLVASDDSKPNCEHAHTAFEFAKPFMREYQNRVNEERAIIRSNIRSNIGVRK